MVKNQPRYEIIAKHLAKRAVIGPCSECTHHAEHANIRKDNLGIMSLVEDDSLRIKMICPFRVWLTRGVLE